MKKYFFTLLFASTTLFGQEDLLNEIDNDSVSNEVTSAFKSVKIVNLESTKLVAKGDFYLVISHRFGYINTGIDELFGLDNATTNIKFIYGLKDYLSVQLARSTFDKALDFGVKFELLKQKTNGSPVAIVGFNSITVNTALQKSLYPKLTFYNRLAYVNQLLVSRKFNDRLTLQLAPTHFHENTVLFNGQENSQFALGLGGRMKVAKRISLNLDYVAHLNRHKNSNFTDPISIGLDWDTGGHVFQLHFTNARAMHEVGFLGQTSGNFFKGDIAFGFNLVRVF